MSSYGVCSKAATLNLCRAILLGNTSVSGVNGCSQHWCVSAAVMPTSGTVLQPQSLPASSASLLKVCAVTLQAEAYFGLLLLLVAHAPPITHKVGQTRAFILAHNVSLKGEASSNLGISGQFGGICAYITDPDE